MNDEGKVQSLTVQVSIKLNQEELDLNEDMVFEDTAGASSKFIIPWIEKKLIKGLRHNKFNAVFDDICDFRSWVEDFRVVGRTHRYAQMYFTVIAVAPWKSLIDERKSIFRENGINVLLKRTKVKG